MANISALRLVRRIIIKRFGNWRNFIAWLLAVIITIYVLDTFVLSKQNLSLIMGHKTRGTKQEAQKLPVASNVDQPKPDASKQEAPKPPDAPKPDVPKPDAAKPDPPKPDAPKPDPPEADAQKPDVPKQDPPKPVENAQPVNKPPEPVPGKPLRQGKKCTVDCPPGQISYYLKSGKDRNISPELCFDGNYVMSEQKKIAGRGLNVVVINQETFEVEDTRTFDLYESDEKMLRYLKVVVKDERIILAATLDEASYHLTPEGRKAVKEYGSVLFEKLNFRDNFIMIGQKGLEAGKAIEKLLARVDGNEFGETVEMSGCVTVPLGKITPIVITEDERILLDGGPRIGRDKTNCGVKENCGDNAFSVQLFTGIENKYMSKMCIGGKYVFGEGLNDCGRGMNIAVVSPQTKEVVRVGHFDTFGTDSINLEIFLEMMQPNEILLAITYDEATKNLDLPSQKLLQSFGSSFANKLLFRDAWVFVGQHGLNGYSEIEEVSPANGNWPKPIDKILCVPTKLQARSSPLPDPPRITVKPAQ